MDEAVGPGVVEGRSGSTPAPAAGEQPADLEAARHEPSEITYDEARYPARPFWQRLL